MQIKQACKGQRLYLSGDLTDAVISSLCTYRPGGCLHDSSAASSVFIRFLSAETRPEEIGAELSQGSWDCCSSLEKIKAF